MGCLTDNNIFYNVLIGLYILAYLTEPQNNRCSLTAIDAYYFISK